jgi:sigma-E factor negative regulatory protein RseB
MAAPARLHAMRAAFPAVLTFVGALGCTGYVAAETSGDALAWLKKIAAASRQINYAGTFVYQHGRKMETSRIAHRVDAGGEFEKLETLDGPQREIVRNNENITCYLPDTKTVIIEKRTMRQFPALLPEQWSDIAENYVAIKEGQDRVAGYDCQVITLEPKDNLRYGHKFCAELASGLPLRARTVNEKGELVDLFAFTQLTIGGAFNKDLLKSRFAGKSGDWHVERSELGQGESGGTGDWMLKSPLAGFKKLTEMKRSIAGRQSQVAHIVYSDGLAAVSVFVETMPKSPPPQGPTYQGAVNMYVTSTSGQMVTVVGETPARTVKQIAESFAPRER